MAHSVIPVDPKSTENVAELRKVFSHFDKSGSGTISVKELGNIMESMGFRPSRFELKKVIKAFDTNKNGEMDFPEFLIMMEIYSKNNDPHEETKLAFQIFDQDNNGLISPAELKNVFFGLGEQVTDDDVNDMIKVADLDGDGKLNYAEFTRMMRLKETQQ